MASQGKQVRRPVHSDEDSGSEDVAYRSKQQAKKAVHDSDSDHNAEGSDDDHKSVSDNEAQADDSTKLEIFVKSLSFDIDEEALTKIFGKYGKMTKCKLIQ